MTELRDHALDYARQGLPVFPLKPKGKTPITEHGLHDATTDEQTIRSWWAKTPTANIGIRTGIGFDVLDLDGPDGIEAVKALFAEHGEPGTTGPVVKTAKGYHYLYAPTGMGNKAGALPHVDWRGAGGYVVAPPSIHETGHVYRWAENRTLENSPLPAIPPFLQQALNPPRSERTTGPVVGLPENSEGTAYGLKALTSELTAMSTAAEGTRNHTLYRGACNIYELVNGGQLHPQAIHALSDAAQAAGLPEWEVDRTLHSAHTQVGNAARVPTPRTAPKTEKRGTEVSRMDARRIEYAAAGSVVVNPELLNETAQWLDPEHFRNQEPRLVYAAALAIHREGGTVDPQTVRQRVRHENQGRELRLTGFTADLPSAPPDNRYAFRVREAAIRRDLEKAGLSMQQAARTRGMGDALDRADQAATTVAEASLTWDLMHNHGRPGVRLTDAARAEMTARGADRQEKAIDELEVFANQPEPERQPTPEIAL